MRILRLWTLWGVTVLLVGLGGTTSAHAGSIWNVDGEDELEKTAKSVATAFFRGVAGIYDMLGSIEERSFDKAKAAARGAATELARAADSCRKMLSVGSKDAKFQKRLKEVVGLVDVRRKEHEAAKAIPVAEVAVWTSVSSPVKKVSFDETLKLCDGAIGTVRTTFAAVRASVDKDTVPPIVGIWQLMTGVEAGLLNGRYLSIIMSPLK